MMTITGTGAQTLIQAAGRRPNERSGHGALRHDLRAGPAVGAVLERNSDQVRALAGIGEEVGAFVRLEEVEQFADALPESIDRTLLGFAQVGLEFREALFDRVEIGRIGRQVFPARLRPPR